MEMLKIMKIVEFITLQHDTQIRKGTIEPYSIHPIRVFNLLLEKNIKATNFVIGGWMGDYMPYEFIEMRLNNVEPQSHSFLMHESGCPNSKGKLVCSDYDTIYNDTLMSLQYVGDGFSYCYPFGHYENSVFEPMMQAGVKLAFTTEYGKISPGDNLMKLKRIRISADDSIDAYKSKLS